MLPIHRGYCDVLENFLPGNATGHQKLLENALGRCSAAFELGRQHALFCHCTSFQDARPDPLTGGFAGFSLRSQDRLLCFMADHELTLVPAHAGHD